MLFKILSLGMKYYGVTIQMKPFGQNFWVVLFISDTFGIFAKIYW